LALFLCAACAPRAIAESALPKTHGAMLDSVAGMIAADLLRGGPIPAGHAVRIAADEPGHDAKARSGDGRQCCGDAFEIRGTIAIRRLDPALPAADHAAEEDVLLAGCEPDADLGP